VKPETRCLVLGASGKVGMRLCERLRVQKCPVVGVARFSDPDTKAELESYGVQTIVFDVTEDDPASLPEVDLVFLEIWDPGRPELNWAINFFGVGKVVSRYQGQADFVNGSTCSLYGLQSDPPCHEQTMPRPRDDYSLARMAQEKLIDFKCMQSGSGAVHLRYAHANTEDSGVIRRVADSILAGESLGQPEAEIQVIGMEDFVRCTLDAVPKVANPPIAINICHPHVWTMRELAERIHRELGQGEPVFDAPDPAVKSAVWDPSLMLAELGPPQEDLDAVIDAVCRAALQDAQQDNTEEPPA